MNRERIEVEIGPEGEVRVLVKGRKGPRCLDYRSLFREFLGPIRASATTDEYYEDEPRVCIRQVAGARR